MSALVEDLLVLARLDADGRPGTTAVEPVDVLPVVEEVVGRYDGARVPVTVRRVDARRRARPTATTCGGPWPTWSTTRSVTRSPSVRGLRGRRRPHGSCSPSRTTDAGIAEARP